MHKPLSPRPEESSVGFLQREGQSLMYFFFSPLHFAAFYLLKGRAEYKCCCFYQTGRSIFREKEAVNTSYVLYISLKL